MIALSPTGVFLATSPGYTHAPIIPGDAVDDGAGHFVLFVSVSCVP